MQNNISPLNDETMPHIEVGGDAQREWDVLEERSSTQEQTLDNMNGGMGDLEYELSNFKRLDCPITLNPYDSTDIDVAMHAKFRQRLSIGTIEKRLRYKRFMERHDAPVDFYPPNYENFIQHMDYRETTGATANALKHEKKTILMFAKAFGLEDQFKKYQAPKSAENNNIMLPFPYTVREFFTHQYVPNHKSYINKLYQTMHFHNFMLGYRAPNELAHMKLDYVRIDNEGNGTISIYQQKRHGKIRIVVPPKSVLSSSVHKSFKMWIDKHRPKVANQYSENYLYLQPSGKPFKTEHLGIKLRQTGQQIYPEYHPYIARHWNAVAMLIESKINTGKFDVYSVRNWMDHENIKTTMGYVRYAEQYYQAYKHSWINHALKRHKNQNGGGQHDGTPDFPNRTPFSALSGKVSPVGRYGPARIYLFQQEWISQTGLKNAMCQGIQSLTLNFFSFFFDNVGVVS